MTSVKEADVVDVAESVGPVDRLHNLLLAMTGRVDDDAINSAREMLGVGQLDAAAEFLAGCLLAGRIPVDSTEQYHLRQILAEARSEQALADRLQVVESLPTDQHRFSDQNETDADLLAALGPVAGRLGGVRALWCAWRVTPAGVTYGAVPQRVLLAEVGPDGSVAAAGYQLIEALRRAGLGCSVEVFNSGTELPAYHRNALATSRRVHLDMPPVTANRNGGNRARAPRPSSGGDSRGSNDLPSEPRASTAAPTPDPAVGEQLPANPAVAEPVPRPSTPPEPVTAPVAPADLGEEHEPAIEDEPLTEHEPAIEHERVEPVTAGIDVEPAAEDERLDDREQFGAWHAEEPVTAPVPDASQENVREPQEDPVSTAVPSGADSPHQEGEADADQDEGSKNMRVPAAVDAKLTNRERNLLRKLHEELAQREQDRDENSGERQEAWTAMPGTGGFPPRGAGPAPANGPAENKAENKQP